MTRSGVSHSLFVIRKVAGIKMILSKIEKNTYDLAENLVTSRGYEIYDVEYAKEGPHWFLRVYIDRDGGVNVDDCEAISRELSVLLDEKDYVKENYFLEISSPGIERVLRQEEHFQKAIGENVRIKLYKAVDGVKEAEGVLLSADTQKIVVETDAGQFDIEKKNIAKANIKFDF